MIPARYAPVLFGFLLSGLMSLIVSAIATYRAGVCGSVLGGWLSSWLIAFPTVLVIAQLTLHDFLNGVWRRASYSGC